MKKYYFLLSLIFISNFSISQEEAEECNPPSKKVMKLIDAAISSKTARDAIGKFNEAIALDEDNATTYYEYAMYAYESGLKFYETYPQPTKGDQSFKKAEEMFELTIDACSHFHANCYYYLGVINYTQGDMATAIKWFEEFVAFKNNDVERYPEDYSKKLADVEEVLADFKQEAAIKSVEVPFFPQIVANVSTENNEYFPMISPDNELIFYTRKLDKKNLGDIQSNVVEEFTFSMRSDMFSDFDGGEAFSAPFNDGSVQSYGSASLSVDNKEMVICACKREEVYGQAYMNCDLYTATYERSGEGGNDFEWSELVNMGTGINTNDGWEAQPSMSADGNTLYYTVNRPTSQGNDIYVATRKEDGTWGEGMPFDVINTAGKDKSPFLHQDSETLYFVSEVSKDRPGVGGLDIFYIRHQPDGTWSEPKNIGYPINSEADELGLFVSIDGEVAYFSSRVKGNWNIYSFELYEEARPKSVALLKGNLQDENGEPVSDAVIEISYEGSDEVTQVRVNGDDGSYAAIVKTEVEQDVMVTVIKENHAFDSKLIAKEDLQKEDVVLRGNDLEVKELKVGEAYTINDILYGINSSQLNSNSKFILKGFARFLSENPTIEVSIQGHTDDVGDDEKNMELSALRAKGVKDFLVSLGIDQHRLKAEGLGETEPKVENNSAANRAINRRTEFVITGL